MEKLDLILAVLFILFCVIDAEFYRCAKYPNRCTWYFKGIPGGGIWAYFKFKKIL